MARTAFVKKKPYLDTEDTLEEVDISRRQLNYWREKGLFTPEFGEDAKKFTEKDVKVLKFARRLIVEQDFPVEVAKRLLDAATAPKDLDEWWWEADLDDFQYLDIASGTLLTRARLESSFWNYFGATAEADDVERRFYVLALLLFRLIRLTAKDGKSFEARQNEIMKRLRGLAIAARVRYGSTSWSNEPTFYLDPEIDNENLKPDVLESWVAYNAWMLDGFKEVKLTPYERAMKAGRFWDRETLAAAKRWREDQEKAKPTETQYDVDGDSIYDIPF